MVHKSENTIKMVDKAKVILERGCPNGETHFMRVEIAPNESCCRIWCPDCGWETSVDREPDPAPEEIITQCSQCSKIILGSPEFIFKEGVFCSISCKAAFLEKLLVILEKHHGENSKYARV